MIQLFAAVGAFLGGWIGWAVVSRRKGMSGVVAYGGGFIVGCVLTIPVLFLAVWLEAKPLPPSLEAAGFVSGEKAWSDDRLKLAVKITRASLKNGETVLVNADEKGDTAAVVPLFDLVTHMLRIWEGQPSGAAGGRYRDCVLAAVHLGDGAQAVWQGGRYTRWQGDSYPSRTRFIAALDGCDV